MHYILDKPSDNWQGLSGFVTEDVVKVGGAACLAPCAPGLPRCLRVLREHALDAEAQEYRRRLNC